PAEDSLFLRQPPRHFNRIVRLDGYDSIKQAQIEIARNKPVADAFDFMFAPLASRQQRTFGRLAGIKLDLLFFLSEIASDPGQLTARSLGANVSVELTAGLFPDFRTGSLVMRLDVIGVVELRWQPVFLRVLVANLREFLKRKIDIGLAAGGVDHLCAISYRHFLALFAHALGHYNDARISFDRGDERTSDAGVAGRAFEYCHSRFEIASLLGALDHIQVDSVLERSGRAEVFEFDKNLSINVRGYAIQSNERRIANAV